jgi:hypothetical protein
MSEIEKKDPAVKEPAFDAEAALKAELAKLPSFEALEKQKKELSSKFQELEKLQDLKLNYGPGKPGKKWFNLERLPTGLGTVRINEKEMVGKIELTHAEYANYVSVQGGRMDHEKKSRLGEGGVAEMELMMLGVHKGVDTGRSGEFAKY